MRRCRPTAATASTSATRIHDDEGLAALLLRQRQFEQGGLEFFVFNGGGGLAGVRKKNDPKHMIFARDRDIAQNLNMQAAKSQCVTGRFSVSADREGIISFRCGGPEMAHIERFQVASKAEWTAWAKYLNR